MPIGTSLLLSYINVVSRSCGFVCLIHHSDLARSTLSLLRQVSDMAGHTHGSNPSNIEHRFMSMSYSDEDCAAAIRGESLPKALGLYVTQLCVLRGIRHHHGFGTALRGIPGHSEFSRALNARDIMSNVIPEMSHPDEFPYCVWHPDVAAEETYRQLVRRYPHLRYHVGRACAVAGYIDLYRELDLLPDSCIAEEARDHAQNANSKRIFDEIMARPSRLTVMDDYACSVNLDSPAPAPYGLNADTAVVSSLGWKQDFERPAPGSRFYDGYQPTHPLNPPSYFNITEDHGIGEPLDDEDAHFHDQPATNESAMTDLLWSPLPHHLPEGNKDLLILMAAYYGNIDRYTRLRRPILLQAEPGCIIRGIYHNTLFAKWYSLQPAATESRFARAITARFIMSNDLSRVTATTPPEELPYLIWYPTLAHEATYQELARRNPAMVPAVARAAVVADYSHLWDSLLQKMVPEEALFAEAKASSNPHYLDSLRRRCVELGLPDLEATAAASDEDHFAGSSRPLEPSATEMPAVVDAGSVGWDMQGPFDGYRADVGMVELWACMLEEMRPCAGEDVVSVVGLYEDMGEDEGERGSREHRLRGRGRGRGGRGRDRGGR